MKHPFIQLGVAALILVIAIGAYGVWFVAVDTENAKARSLASEIQTKSQDATRIAEAKAALNALATNEASVSMHFVSANDVVPFLGSLQSTGSSLGSTVDVLSVGADPATKAGQGHINISVHISGPFDSVVRTLGALEYAPYDITLTNLSLDTADKNMWSAAASFSVGTGPASSTPATAAPAVPATTTSS
jgi:Tfp pilus assembly protein PilO